MAVACAFPVDTAQAPGCSAGKLSKACPGLRALPRTKPLMFRFSGTPQRHSLGWVCVLCPSQVWAAQATRCLVSALSLVCTASYHLPDPAARFSGCAARVPSQVCRVSPGGCQPPQIPGTLGYQLGACSQFGGGCRLWGRDCLLPSSSGYCQPASLPPVGGGADPQPASSPLVFAQSFVLWVGQAVP